MIPGFTPGQNITLNLSALNSMTGAKPAASCLLFKATTWFVDPDHTPVPFGTAGMVTWPNALTTGPYLGWYDWATYQQDLINGTTPPMLVFS